MTTKRAFVDILALIVAFLCPGALQTAYAAQDAFTVNVWGAVVHYHTAETQAELRIGDDHAYYPALQVVQAAPTVYHFRELLGSDSGNKVYAVRPRLGSDMNP